MRRGHLISATLVLLTLAPSPIHGEPIAITLPIP